MQARTAEVPFLHHARKAFENFQHRYCTIHFWEKNGLKLGLPASAEAKPSEAAGEVTALSE